jgi:hypothetical protein
MYLTRAATACINQHSNNGPKDYHIIKVLALHDGRDLRRLVGNNLRILPICHFVNNELLLIDGNSDDTSFVLQMIQEFGTSLCTGGL